MSTNPDIAELPCMGEGPVPPTSNNADWQHLLEWPARIFFGVVLAVIAIAATVAGGFYFAAMLALVSLAATREWHRMVGGPKYGREIAMSATAIAVAVFWFVAAPHGYGPWLLVIAASVLCALSALQRGMPPALDGVGALYIGVPVLCAVALRTLAPNGMLVAIALFLIIWAGDTGALLTGRLIGGPKLVPALSPNKTWAGLAGGVAAPAAVMAGLVVWFGGNPWPAAALGGALALMGHTGDLFESWLKRRVGRKNSGSLIPGHGGVLDRIDSALFVAPLASILVFFAGLDPLFGAHL